MNRVLLTIVLIPMAICACKGPAGPVGADGAGYESVSDPGVRPTVIFTDPPDASIGPFDSYNQFQIRFSKIMDISSLKRAIRFTSSLGDVLTDTGSVATSTGDVVTVSAGGSWGTRYGFF